MRLIDAEAKIKMLLYDEEHEEQITREMTVEEALDLYTEDGCPTIDAEPIRHGKWRKVDYQIFVGKGAFVGALECSVCEEPNYEMSNYCPRCGAKMDEVEE